MTRRFHKMFALKKECKRDNIHTNNSKWIPAITIPFVIVYLLMSYVFGLVLIRGDSMLPTYADYDMVLILRTGYTPEYGDVLVCSSSNYSIIKRVIGKPGDIIDIKNNLLTVNGTETVIDDITSGMAGTVILPHIVSNDSYFLVGDNIAQSKDSRFSDIGDIHQTQIIGKVLFKVRGNNNE